MWIGIYFGKSFLEDGGFSLKEAISLFDFYKCYEFRFFLFFNPQSQAIKFQEYGVISRGFNIYRNTKRYL